MSNRDYVMARLGAALSANLAQREVITAGLAIFTDPEDDAKGEARKECVTDALMLSHESATALNFALERLDTMGADELAEGEEDEDDDGDEATEGEGDEGGDEADAA
jgi:hypothetical protein